METPVQKSSPAAIIVASISLAVAAVSAALNACPPVPVPASAPVDATTTDVVQPPVIAAPPVGQNIPAVVTVEVSGGQTSGAETPR